MTLELFKQCISLIVLTRSRMAIETEYSLCILLESAVQMLEFSTDLTQFLDQVLLASTIAFFLLHARLMQLIFAAAFLLHTR